MSDADTTPLPPMADLPSGIPPTPSSSLPPIGKPQPIPTIPVRALLRSLPSNLDAFLLRLNKCLSTPAGIDTVMLFLCYTSRLSATALSSLSHSVLRRSAREWIALVSALPPRTTVLFTTTNAGTGKGPSNAAAAAALVLAARLKALSSLLSEARTILRLWALLGMYFWAKRLVSSAVASLRGRSASSSSGGEKKEEKEESAVATAVEWTRLGLCVGLQALENGAYLSSKGVMGWTPRQQGLAYKWSARFWAAYVGIELGKLLAERFGPAAAAAARAKKEGGEKEEKEVVEWRKKVVRNAAWMPLTIHWSTDKGIVSEPLVGLLASIPGIIQMRDLWASTA